MEPQLIVSDDAELFCLTEEGRVFPMGDLDEWMIALAAHQNHKRIYFYAARKAA